MTGYGTTPSRRKPAKFKVSTRAPQAGFVRRLLTLAGETICSWRPHPPNLHGNARSQELCLAWRFCQDDVAYVERVVPVAWPYQPLEIFKTGAGGRRLELSTTFLFALAL